MGNFQTVIYEKSENIAYVTLNRPHVLNSYNIQMRDELYQVLSAIRDDDEVMVVILKGAGDKAFCAGADLTDFLTAPSPVVTRQTRRERDVWGLFLSLPQPIIAALHGYVLGSGIEMALCCDLRIAAEDAQFGLPEVGLGIIPAAGATQTLPRAIGRARALEMLLTTRRIKAKEACDIGLVNQVVPRAKLYMAAEEMARKIMRHSQKAIRLAKQAVVRGLDLPLADSLELERKLAALSFADRRRQQASGSNTEKTS
jgi:enoyl-CoA hydratase/carnithine racemase